ncbi:MAG: DUF3775 domain-containing protein [Alphaproteobacteria bacterium]|nr:DUF3775 domain-containing protein [Alphaproteobacteria bacterium]
MLQIDLPTVCAIVARAREFHAKVAIVEPDPGSNPSDEDMREVLEDYPDDPVQQELRQILSDLNVDQLADLVTLTWLGRGDFDVSQWSTMRAEALRLDPRRTPDYLIETPLVADYLAEGLAALGLSCVGIEPGG